MSKVEPTGLGGSMNVTFACNGCKLRTVNFCGSALVEGSKRTVVGLALAVAFFITGHGYAKFSRTLRQCLGISCISKNPYYETIKLVYPKVTEILNGMCDEEKERMKQMSNGQLGSWKRAVVTSDGVWHTRGHFSKNGSFIIKKIIVYKGIIQNLMRFPFCFTDFFTMHVWGGLSAILNNSPFHSS